MIAINSKKVARIGDIHIGVNKNSEGYFELTKTWMKMFIDELVSRKINTVFILGDWHHYRDDILVKTLDVSSKIMNMFPKNITIHMITGNHDCYFRDNSEIHSLRSFNEWENVNIYDEVTEMKIVGDKTLTLVPWGCDINTIQPSEYVFGHFEIQNFKWNSFSVCEHGLDSSDLLKNGVNIYSGHFHKYQTKEYKKGSITYLGSPFQHNFNDVGNENGFHILDLDSGEREFVTNDDMPVYKYIKVSKIKDDLTKENICGNFIKLFIDIDGVTEGKLDKLSAKIHQHLPRSLVIEDKTLKKDIDNREFDGIIEVIDISGSFKEYIDTLDIKYKAETLEAVKKYYETTK